MAKQSKLKTNETVVTIKKIHFGQFLRAFLSKHRLPIAALARHLNIHPEQIQRHLKSEDVRASVLLEFCHAYQHNFFADLAVTLPPHYLHAQPDTSPQERIAELEMQLKQVTAERDVLKEVISGK
ncbi:MAG: helix-turn-helix domain-containing protein [Aquaticitalea sp.]